MEQILIKAMAVAGYHYDDIDSYDGYLVFDGDYCCVRMTFESWYEVEEWLRGVVFDDPDVSGTVEMILKEVQS